MLQDRKLARKVLPFTAYQLGAELRGMENWDFARKEKIGLIHTNDSLTVAGLVGG